MNLFSFTVHFGTEEDCRNHFKEQRDLQGVICATCSSKEHYWKKDKWSYECKVCKYRTSLRKGTIMESSKLPFLIWYKTIFLMNMTKKSFSAKEIQKKLGLKRYEPVWSMVHKLRKVMETHDTRYTLEGMIEFNEAFFTVAPYKIEKEKGEQNIAMMTKSTSSEDTQTYKKDEQVRFFNAKVLQDYNSEKINETITNNQNIDSIKNTSYIDIADFVKLHVIENNSKETTEETLEWIHIAISNTKKNLLGNYHKIKRKYLQLYLNEFIRELNRRYFENKLFERFVIANITTPDK